MSRFAENTSVPVEKSRAEIEKLVVRYGADQFASGWDGERALINFRMRGRYVRFILPLPDRKSREFTYTPRSHQPRSIDSAREAYDGAVRQRWRALALVIKARLEAVESGISSFEEEFLANLVIPTADGPRTLGEWAIPEVARAYESGAMALLPFSGGSS